MWGLRDLVGILGAAIVLGGCATRQSERTTTCMMVGGLLGALGGAAIGNPNHTSDDPEQGVIGGVIGAALGAGIGNYLCQGDPMAPQARASANPASGQAPLDVDLRGVGTDPDGEIVAYAWDLGDGTSAEGARVSHRYGRPGSYTARLVVTDDEGLTGQASVPIQVAAVPPPAPRRVIVLRGVNFEFDSSRIRPDAGVILDTAAEILSESPDHRVTVTGHTDGIGTEAYNQRLSERRAAAVVEYLVSKGVAASRLGSSGAGELEPVADNQSDDGRAQNRRVELTVAE